MLTPRLACYTLHKSDSPRAMGGRRGRDLRLTFAYEILGALLTGKRTLTLLSLGVAALMEQQIAFEGERFATCLTGEGTIAGVAT